MKQIVTFLKPNQEENLKLELDRKGHEGELLVAFVGKDKEEFKLKTLQLHQGEHTDSYCMVRGVLFDQSSADIKGLIKITKEGQHTNAFLEEKILIVSDNAKAVAEPQLEIEANEVKASHAATVGKLDQEQVFYLMSRGVSKAKAQELLVMGFLQPVLDRVKDEERKKEIETEIRKNLSAVKN